MFSYWEKSHFLANIIPFLVQDGYGPEFVFIFPLTKVSELETIEVFLNPLPKVWQRKIANNSLWWNF